MSYKIIIILLLIYLFLIKGKSSKIDKRPYAHRGFHDQHGAPAENTLSAFKKAKDYGYGIELDVQLTRDEKVVVFHDETLKRMAQDKRKVSELNFDELKSINILGSHIPTLEETLTLVSGQVPLIVELKSHGNYRKLCSETAQLLDCYEGDFVIESFDPRIVYWFRKNRPNFRRGILVMNYKKYDSIMQGLLINSLLLNVLMRPHFIALAKDVVDKHPSVLLYRYLNGNIVVWTIHENDPYKKEDIIIFEYFRA